MMTRDDMVTRMRDAMERALTDRQREVVLRHFVGGEPYWAIARDRGCSVPAVCQMQRRALRKLRQYCFVPAYNPGGRLD
ncbi:sigma factor-like helix-turn-helix DNA-binding protein [Faecousia sp.]|uniref:sigma factor-like helix-turn-helix DNA-binding protein n=1 Tax=Faecousia sp. TaxID=2952921 RepID=UPI003AB43AE5